VHRILQFLWYRRDEGLAAKILLAPLWLASHLYSRIASGRRQRLAGRGAKVTARVISIGNLTVGGAGKTPVAIHIARELQKRNARPAVLSRGYGRLDENREAVVSDGECILESARRAGDEPLLIARSCPGVPVLVGPDRASLARQAIARFGARTLVLDDGFQHFKLRRDLDVVVLDASNPFGNGCLLPRGPLREPQNALSHAGLIWLSKVDQAPEAQILQLAGKARALTGREPVRSSYRISSLEGAAGRFLPPGALSGMGVLMCAGLARPGSFRRTLESAGAQVLGQVLFGDHHLFSSAEIERVTRRAGRCGAEAIAITEKDAVRLPSAALPHPWLVVRIEVEILSGAEILAELC
jgi:tetraacyldisaccharide 4'-kinase